MKKIINMRTNKINNFIYGLLAVFTLTLTSCDKDFLVKTDPGSGSVDGFFQGEDEFVLGREVRISGGGDIWEAALGQYRVCV